MIDKYVNKISDLEIANEELKALSDNFDYIELKLKDQIQEFQDQLSHKNNWRNIAYMAQEELNGRKIMYKELQKQLAGKVAELRAAEAKYRRRTKQFFCSSVIQEGNLRKQIRLNIEYATEMEVIIAKKEKRGNVMQGKYNDEKKRNEGLQVANESMAKKIKII